MASTTKKKSSRRGQTRQEKSSKARKRNPLGGWLNLPKSIPLVDRELIEPLPTNFDGQLMFIEFVKQTLVQYALRIKLDHSETDRDFFVGHSARRTQALLIRIAQRLDSRTEAIRQDIRSFDDWIHLQNM